MAEGTLRVKAGQTVVREGTVGNTMYVIDEGHLEVSRRHGDTKVVLAHLGPGAIFGEMGLLESAPRSATVTAVEDSTVVAVDSSALLSRIAADPMFALKLLQRMSARLRRLSDELVVAALEAASGDDKEARDKVAEIEHQPAPGYL